MRDMFFLTIGKGDEQESITIIINELSCGRKYGSMEGILKSNFDMKIFKIKHNHSLSRMEDVLKNLTKEEFKHIKAIYDKYNY